MPMTTDTACTADRDRLRDHAQLRVLGRPGSGGLTSATHQLEHFGRIGITEPPDWS
jgi:hypothetical protein